MIKKPKFKVFKGENSFYYFTLKAGNGEPILTSQRYVSLQAAEKGIQSVIENARDDRRFVRKITDNLMYYFVIKARNGQVIGLSEAYSSKSGRERGIRAVKRAARVAKIEFHS
ncbi:MAG: YegP family protein [Bacteroidia bacterium]|nr:YegP family protein [Bacteroidia bacterium]